MGSLFSWSLYATIGYGHRVRANSRTKYANFSVSLHFLWTIDLCYLPAIIDTPLHGTQGKFGEIICATNNNKRARRQKQTKKTTKNGMLHRDMPVI